MGRNSITNLIEKLFRKKPVEPVEAKASSMFDRKYKTVLKFTKTTEYSSMIDWVDKNSTGLVSIRQVSATLKIDPSTGGFLQINSTVYVGFENEDDAIFFRIKYSI